MTVSLCWPWVMLPFSLHATVAMDGTHGSGSQPQTVGRSHAWPGPWWQADAPTPPAGAASHAVRASLRQTQEGPWLMSMAVNFTGMKTLRPSHPRALESCAASETAEGKARLLAGGRRGDPVRVGRVPS